MTNRRSPGSGIASALCPGEITRGINIAWKLYKDPKSPPAKQSPPRRPDLAPLDSIARELGVTRQAVDNTIRRALPKCRQWCEMHGYRLEDLLDGC